MQVPIFIHKKVVVFSDFLYYPHTLACDEM